MNTLTVSQPIELFGPQSIAMIAQVDDGHTATQTFSDGDITFQKVTFTDWYFQFTHPTFGDMIVMANSADDAQRRIHEMLSASTKDKALAIASRR